MLAVKSMDVRDNFKSLCDKVFNGETLIISRPKNENIVMLSEAEYNEMMKAKRNAEYLAMLDKSMAEAEAGGFVTKSIEELESGIPRYIPDRKKKGCLNQVSQHLHSTLEEDSDHQESCCCILYCLLP